MSAVSPSGQSGRTSITEAVVEMPVARLGAPSRLPKFRRQQPGAEHRTAPSVGLSEDESRNAFTFGQDSILPYRVFDDYDHHPMREAVPVLVMDNGRLRLTVAPQWGGRLLSLRDHRRGRDLVFANPVFQPGNLGVLNAWFSGGIEWNGVIPGHTPVACAPVFAATLETSRGPVLRLYEFDRVLEASWQVDLFLPDDDDRLFVHGRIVNADDTDKLAYWWTNVAAPLWPGMRVVSPAEHAIEHVLPGNGLASFPFPDPTRFDGSYPHLWRDATSVFFRAPNAKRLWLAALDRDGNGLGQVATARMEGRKFFYFGTGSGGQNWMDRLSVPGQGDYIELQSGIAPTQNQRFVLPARSEVQWTECYGAVSVEAGSAHAADYQKAVSATGAAMAARFPAEELAAMDGFLRDIAARPPERRLAAGSAWGSRHERLTGRRLAAGLDFTVANEPAGPWTELLASGSFSTATLASVPDDFAVSDRWVALLRRSGEASGESWLHALALGIAALDREDAKEAARLFERSLAAKETWLGYRQLALVAATPEAAERAYFKAWTMPGAPPELADEIVGSLLEGGRTAPLQAFLMELPELILGRERVVLGRARLAAQLGEVEPLEALLATDFVTIREGEGLLESLWQELQRNRLRRALGREPTTAEVAAQLVQQPLPGRLDFRMKIETTGQSNE